MQSRMDPGEAYLGRQPIVDRNGKLVGYELLYRDAVAHTTDVGATVQVVMNLLAGVGFDDALGGFRASINVNAEFLFSDLVELLAPERFVLEILETVCATPALVARVQELKTRGFSFALDDFSGETANNVPFLGLVDVVKVDIQQVPADCLEMMVCALRRHRAILLAEKIEDATTYERCLLAGFELFQGYHFARPQVLVGRRPDPQRTHVRTLLERVMGNAPAGKPKHELKRQPAFGGVRAWDWRPTPRPAA